MAFVGSPFVHDIFLSYGHGRSDGANEPRLKRWSLAFARELESEIRAYPEIDATVSIFRDDSPRPDEGLRPNGSIADQLQSNCNAALLVTLVSPWYLGSKWCESEREWWLTHRAHLRAVEKSVYADGNVFVVHVWHSDDLPAELRGSADAPVGIWFYDRLRGKLEPQPYEWPEPTPTSRDPFRKQLVTLAGWIKTRLLEIHRHQQARQQAQEAARRLVEHEHRFVYLYGRDEYKEHWHHLRNTLMDGGFVIFPDQPEPDHGNDSKRILKARDERLKTLRGMDALLLVSPRQPEEVDADVAAVGRSDRLAALTHSTRPLPCALIDTVGAHISTPSRRARALMMSVEWIDATHEGWVERIHEWLVRVGQTEAAR